jgi:chemotaxis protein MotB
MGRRHKHEDHQNHEAWAIPYGDLITLLLAFFVVMYAVSSVNEGKYRVLSDALAAAFRGPPRSPEPVQLDTKPSGRGGRNQYPGSPLRSRMQTRDSGASASQDRVGEEGGNLELARIGKQVEDALAELVQQNMVIVRQRKQWLEIEIRTDILFASGDAQVADRARPVLDRVAAILAGLPNSIRVEGHTDDVPIRTVAYPSNWELSAARAASVVHLFMTQGVDPARMEISGFGQYRPKAPNASSAGRDQNRRVVIIVLGPSLREPGMPGGEEVAAPAPTTTAGPVPGDVPRAAAAQTAGG